MKTETISVEKFRQMIKARRWLAIAVAGWMMAGTASAQARGDDGFDPLVGRWTCDGYFVKSGKKIASLVEISRDAPSRALIVRHDDSAPNVYHALELWTSTAGAAPFRAAIANESGMRWYVSAGWIGDRLAWSRPDGANPEEQFIYILDPAAGTFQIDWLIARNGGTPTLGDRLTCRR